MNLIAHCEENGFILTTDGEKLSVVPTPPADLLQQLAASKTEIIRTLQAKDLVCRAAYAALGHEWDELDQILNRVDQGGPLTELSEFVNRQRQQDKPTPELITETALEVISRLSANHAAAKNLDALLTAAFESNWSENASTSLEVALVSAYAAHLDRTYRAAIWGGRTATEYSAAIMAGRIKQ